MTGGTINISLMGTELGDLQGQVLQQGLAVELWSEGVLTHLELPGMVVHSETCCEAKAQEGSGGRQEEPTTADTVGRGAVSLLLEISDGGAGSRHGSLEVSYSPGSSSRS